MLEYGLLIEAERLDAARALDEEYHRAKLMAAAVNQPERIWEEHSQVRAALLAQHEPARPSQLPPMEVIAAIHQRLVAAGLRKPDSGAMN